MLKSSSTRQVICAGLLTMRKASVRGATYVTVLLFNFEHIVGDRISHREMKV